MDKKATLLQEFRKYCKDLEFDFEESSQEIQELISSEKVIDYYLSRGPFPSFPETIIDVFILTEKFLYNFEITKEGPLRHMIPLNMVTSIAESFSEIENEKFLCIQFRYGGVSSAVLQDKLTKKNNLRKFSGEMGTMISQG